MAHGKLQLAMPMTKIKEISNLSLMVSFLTLTTNALNFCTMLLEFNFMLLIVSFDIKWTGDLDLFVL